MRLAVQYNSLGDEDEIVQLVGF